MMAAPAKFSLALGGKKIGLSLKPKPTTGAKRARNTFDDSDNEDDSATQTRTITSFSGGKAIDENTPEVLKSLRVIAPPPGTEDEGWLERAMRKRQKGPLPSKQQTADDTKETINGGPIAYGLTITEKKEVAQSNEDQATAVEAVPEAPKKTDDELALQALLDGKTESDRVIPTVINEKEAFQQAYQEAPDMASIEAYQATPIEGFGAALLRGMGWKDGQPIGRRRDVPEVQPRVLERRPALLGIGAKPEDATGQELGAWGKGDKSRGRKQPQAYIPVLLRNKRTGEQFTEEELKAKQDQEKLLESGRGEKKRRSKSPERREKPRDLKRIEDNLDRRDRRTQDDDRDRYRSDRKDRDRESHRDRDRDTKTRRSRSTSSTRHRKRRRDDSYDSHRRKERRRDDDYDSSRDKKRRDDDYDSSHDKKRRDEYNSGRDRKRRDDYDSNRDRRRGDDHYYRERDRDRRRV